MSKWGGTSWQFKSRVDHPVRHSRWRVAELEDLGTRLYETRRRRLFSVPVRMGVPWKLSEKKGSDQTAQLGLDAGIVSPSRHNV